VRDLELVRKLQAAGKDFYTPADLEKVTGLDRASLQVSLNRWVSRGVLERVMRGVYVVPGGGARLERIAGQLYFPCYLSFEAALSRLGVLNLVPYTLTFATSRKTRALDLLGRRVEYRQLKPDLFFGFEPADGYYLALPEKALLDLAYLASLGRASLPLDELELGALSLPVLTEMAGRFPARVRERVAGLV
jgi:predicted transcriptional regulator of viral defense system